MYYAAKVPGQGVSHPFVHPPEDNHREIEVGGVISQ